MAWFTDPSLPDLGQAQEGALMSINAMQQTVRAARPLLPRLRPTSPRTVARKGRATRPAADRGRWPDAVPAGCGARLGGQCAHADGEIAVDGVCRSEIPGAGEWSGALCGGGV